MPGPPEVDRTPLGASVRQVVRAILFDSSNRLVLLKRVKPGVLPYWTFPGGGVENFDASFEAALLRELIEELGATALIGPLVLSLPAQSSDSRSVQHFYVVRLLSVDLSRRSGPEFLSSSNTTTADATTATITVGLYTLDKLSQHSLAATNVVPEAVKTFVAANWTRLLAQLP